MQALHHVCSGGFIVEQTYGFKPHLEEFCRALAAVKYDVRVIKMDASMYTDWPRGR
jgi:hypothetical protein